jgi:hypothetical protein
MRRLDQCPYRQAAGPTVGSRSAVCRFLQQFTGIAEETACIVGSDACESCCSWPEPSADRLNPVVASLLYGLADRVIGSGSLPGFGTAQAFAVRERAEFELTVDSQAVDGHIWFVDTPGATGNVRPFGCDVVMCCTDATAQTDAAVRSVLAQEDVAVSLHLVDGGGGAELLSRYGHLENVHVHRNPAPRDLFRTLHELVPHLHSEFVAVQDPATTSRPRRLVDSVWHLVDYGADFLAAAVQTPDGVERPLVPGRSYGPAVPSETLVIRRSALVDMGGVTDRPVDADIELVHRAALEQRAILLSRTIVADRAGLPARREAAHPPEYSHREGTLRHHALGFPAVTVACDVVLPFHGQLDYVREALASLLNQEGAELLVHLVDDASPGASEPFLRQWSRHPQVRTYRNLENLGPYTSFNNVLPYLTTGLVAVQDGDDISLARRIHQAGNALRLSGAEIFGARTRPFGADQLLAPSTIRAGGVKTVARAPYRRSRVPPREPLGHLLEHPTAVYRTAAFERLGGFSDFGRTDRNCCSLDTEFYLRASYAGARFAVSNQVALLYRCHAESATQNAATGWGSAARRWTLRECRRRTRLFQSDTFDPKAYGALGRYAGLTRRYP